MGPLLPERKQANSSDSSDEESNIRHDRFRSERFAVDSKTNFQVRKEKHKHREEYSSSKRHRDESSQKTYKHREINSSSSYRNESRSNHDRKNLERRHHSKSSTFEKKDKPVYSDKTKCEKKDIQKPNSKKLSSLLANFDKRVASKRKESENSLEIEPPLPTVPLSNTGEESSNVNKSEPTLKQIGTTIPSPFKNNSNNINNEDKIKCENSITQGPEPPSHFENPQTEGIDETQNSSKTTLQNTPNSSCPIKNESDVLASSELDISGLGLPPKPEFELFGPALPPNLESNLFGPVLPPNLESNLFGPALPPNFKVDTIRGPTLPSGLTVDQLEVTTQEASEDEDIVGPLPEGKMTITQYQLDLRAMHIKRKLEDEKNGGPSKDITKREDWMLELPPEKAVNLGLGPRSFRMREAPDMSDRSSWTDTPADRLRKQQQALEGKSETPNSEEMMRTAFIKEREEVMEKMSELIQDDERPQSLLELHQKKLKKKKKKEKKEGKKKERRPFDRNIDLQVNRFDEAQKKAIFKKAQLLDTRFSTGESKYL